MEDDHTVGGEDTKVSSKKATVVSINSSVRARSKQAKLVSLSQVYDFKPSRQDQDQALPWERPFEGLHEELRLGLEEGLKNGLKEDPQAEVKGLLYGEFYDEMRDSIIDSDLVSSDEDLAHPDWKRKAGPAATIQESFFHAINGLGVGFRNQRNMRIHCCLAASVLILALIIRVDALGLAALVLVCGFVLFAEMVNTAIEHMVDIQANYKYHLSARYAKDTAAGAVLIAALTACLVGAIVILPRLWQLICGL